MLKKITLVVFIIVASNAKAQETHIKITEEKFRNRLSLYAENHSETDYDVKIIVTGKNIRQSARKPRFIRVPSASKVLLKTLILTRGKQPSYTYNLVINDSLSSRALKMPSVPIKIKPKKQIIVYTTKDCISCDSIIGSLSRSKYLFRSFSLSEKPLIRSRMAVALANTKTPLDSLRNPVINLGGKLYIDIDNYDTLFERINKEK